MRWSVALLVGLGACSAVERPLSHDFDRVFKDGHDLRWFLADARGFVSWNQRMCFERDPSAERLVDGLLARGAVEEVFARHVEWMPLILERLLSRDREIARRAFEVMDRVAQAHSVPGYRFDWSLFEHALYRAAAYEDLCVWYRMNARLFNPGARPQQDWEPWIRKLGDEDPDVRASTHAFLMKNLGYARPALEAARDDPDPEIRARVRMILDALSAGGQDPRDVDWDAWMRDLKFFSCADGGTDDYFYPEDSPGYEKFQKLKLMGPRAYPYLIEYIDNENLQWAKAAVVCLRLLSGRRDLPLPKNREEAILVKERVARALGLGD